MERDHIDRTPTPISSLERAAAWLLAGILGLGIATGCSVPMAQIEPRITNATGEDVTVVLDIPNEHRTECTLPPGGSLTLPSTSVPRNSVDRIRIIAWRTTAPERRATSRLDADTESIRIERSGTGVAIDAPKPPQEAGQ